eukprot:TRINITY_DN5254_c0_g1_i2.p1 TRINITY_DN5254_c0_g1~~TRINITY_DN5254_c0_g1_i2.p1  ORF type:complete len:774 (-),score=177.72 TRINITY_DN5254_c0_g1_i2:22-2343(-)
MSGLRRILSVPWLPSIRLLAARSSSSAPASPYAKLDKAFEATRPFRLSPTFVEQFKDEKKRPFPNALAELVYRRTYSRVKADGENEQWHETVERVVNGTYNMQKQWIERHQLGWNSKKAQSSAQEMYRRIFSLKFLPPGRGLWAMGSPITEEKKLYAALNNCAFVSTNTIKDEPAKPFCFLMDASMLGVGVGFDTQGAGTVVVKGPNVSKKTEVVVITDDREGWVESLRLLLDSYFSGKHPVEFDYSRIRAKGTPIKGFGGVSSGPETLQQLHSDVKGVLDAQIGQPLSVTAIVDIMNMIGRCVVSGNVRRSAEIAFGSATSTEFLDLKNYSINPHRQSYGWTSNNSVFAELGMDYRDVCGRVVDNGEPGFAWLQNMKQYSRMGSPKDNKDHRALGGNPCLEQTLESYELCCLVETFPANHENVEDFLRTLKYAYLYAKTVTLGQTHWPETNRVMLRNRRIGCSMSGLAQYIAKFGIHSLHDLCEKGFQTIQEYDREYSDWLAIPRSIKTTSIKPSGTVSLLAGATSGMHFPESRFFIRRVLIGKDSPLLAAVQRAGYKTESSLYDGNSMCVEFLVDMGEGVRTVGQVSMWEQLSLAAFLQRHWADNQVSCIRRVLIGKDSPLLAAVQRAGYKTESSLYDGNSMCVEFLVDMGEGVRTVGQVSMWEQLSLAAFLQRHWADNQVSCTVSFDPETEGSQLPQALDYFQYQLKGVSFLPRRFEVYPQLPNEEISEAVYRERVAQLKPIDWSAASNVEPAPETFCDNSGCDLPPKTG